MDLQQERRIKNGLERVLKSFKQYYLVPTIEEGDVILVFNKKDIEYFEIFVIDDNIKNHIKDNEFADNIRLYFMRNKNRRNAKRQALADVSKRRFYRQN